LAYHVAVYWVLVRDDAVINDEKALYAKISPPAKLSLLGRCERGVGSALIYSDRSRSPVHFSASALLDSGSLVHLIWRPEEQRFTGEDLIVGCLHYVVNKESLGKKKAQTKSLCDEERNVYLRRFLIQKNISLIYVDHVSAHYATSLVIGGKADILLSRTSLDDTMVVLFSFADTDLHYDTFYALANDTRSISVFTVLSDSVWGVAWTLLSMLACALILASLNSADTFKVFLQCAARETLFLLASLLATSTPEPWHRRRAWTRRAVYACWTVTILSLSVYIRSQMTALVTATKPADHLDTLEELEDAVDARHVTPVVVLNTWTYANLKEGARSPLFAAAKAQRSLQTAPWWTA
ncbi:hypothetical protein MTO96_022719, partial [Rhipicephalus appendiculatus]